MGSAVAVLGGLVLLFVGCSGAPSTAAGEGQTGYASWYGEKFHGRRTASGETYDMHDFTAAHRTAPFGTRARVTNLSNGRSVTVRINDRGPFVRGRVIDLSYAAAKEIGLVSTGTTRVRVEFLGGSSSNGDYYIQVGSFREEDNAQRMLEEVSQRWPGATGKIVPYGAYRRVWIGPLEDEEKAVRQIREMQRAGYAARILRP